MTRVDPPTEGDERATLLGFLDYHRDTLLMKCAGLTPEQLRQRSTPPSELSLLGLVRHLTEVEQGWFELRLAGRAIVAPYSTAADRDGDIHLSEEPGDPAAQATEAEAALAAFTAQRARSDEVLAGVVTLDHTFRHERTGELLSVRWLLVHLVEEYARHNGHADLLREAIDGATGE